MLSRVRPETVTNEDTRVYLPHEVYRGATGIPPGLIVYFGGRGWRSIGIAGSDDTNGALYGIGTDDYPAGVACGRLDEPHRFDVGRTVLSLFDCAPQPGPGVRGRVIGAVETAG